NFPNRENVVAVLHDIQCLIFPGYKTAEELDSVNLRYITGQRVNRIVALLTKEIEKALTYKSIQHDEKSQVKDSHCFSLAEKTSLAMIEAIPEIRRLARLDAIAAFNGDPAAKSGDEVIVSYPGLEAIIVYRIAHFLHECGVPVIPRIMSEHVHGKTGIDIHPGAKIGESFFIDHGTGVVIGETSVIGKNVKIYQGVTLGALSVKKTLQNTKRHPTIEDDVTIYANATILGGETVIGKGSVIGGNSWITESVSNAK
uniref:serine O-acetyltransferase EpsC n=1 Tax=Treponema sp. TaxID=166 RepID=UPI00388D99FB